MPLSDKHREIIDGLKQLGLQSPSVMSEETRQFIRDELMQAWADGMRDGLEMGALMASNIADHEETTMDQRASAAALRDAMRLAALQVEPAARAEENP